MKLLELVSIIVPVYNVEQYLKRCIQSILRQTYVHIEIILVDDGSTDHSGKICDAYSKRDHRIRVFHKHNGGQASARNLGIRNSKGDYLAFVDSDDFVHPEYIQYMYNNLKKYKADLSYCGIRKVISQKISKERKEEIIVFDNLNGLKDLFYQRHLTNGPGDKLYKRKLFDDLYFPEGHIFEDFAIAYKIVSRASLIVYGNKGLYYYQQRKNSTMHQQFRPDHMDRVSFSEELMEYVDQYDSSVQTAAKARFFISNLQVLKEPGFDKKVGIDYYKVTGNIKKYRKGIVKDKNAKMSLRFMAALSYLGMPVMRFLGHALDYTTARILM